MTYNQKWRYVLTHGWSGVLYALILVSGFVLIFSAPLRELLAVYWDAYFWVVFGFFAVVVPFAIRRRFGAEKAPAPQRND
ncbi:hypothetical protein GCM10027403_19330 [Arthrobacter tecti]